MELLLTLNDMKDAGLHIKPETDLCLLKNNLQKLEGFVAVVTKNTEIQQLTREIQEYEAAKQKSNEYFDRCNTAVDALSKLKSLSSYSLDFIDDNLHQLHKTASAVVPDRNIQPRF